MSEFNVTQFAIDASIYNCTPNVVPVSGGTLNFAAACVPYTATDATQYDCVLFNEISIPLESDCQYVFDTSAAQTTDEYYCSISCLYQPAFAARGLPSEEFVTGAASTLHPSSFATTLATLAFITFMFFKRGN